jgi:hypothetical protein
MAVMAMGMTVQLIIVVATANRRRRYLPVGGLEMLVDWRISYYFSAK